jgi:hypothetical protein
MPVEVEQWTPEQREKRKAMLMEAARSFVTSRLGYSGEHLRKENWEICYLEALQSLEAADAEETLGTKGLYPLQILQAIRQDETDSWAEDFVFEDGENKASIQQYIESLSGTGPAQQHMSTNEDRLAYDECCRFFDVPHSSEKDIEARGTVKFDSMTRILKPHQLYGVWWLLKFWANTCGGILSDEQGLGKTSTCIAFAVTIAVLEYVWDDYISSPQSHLSEEKASNPANRCLRRKGLKSHFACPCETSIFPTWLRQKLADQSCIRGFQLFVVPAQCITTWIHEMQACVDLERAFPFRFKLKVAHLDAKGSHKIDDNDLRQLITDQDGFAKQSQSRIFVLTTNRCLQTRLITPIQDIWRKWSKSSKTDAPTRQLAICNMMIDESHQLRGDTHVNKFLTGSLSYGRTKAEFKETPVCDGALFLVSGTPWDKGPQDLRVYFSFYNERWAYDKRCAVFVPEEIKAIRKSCSLKILDRLQFNIETQFNKRFRKGLTEQEAQLVTQKLKGLGQQMGSMLAQVSIRRETGSLWWDGSPIVDLPKIDVDRRDLKPTTEEIKDRLNEDFRVAKQALWETYMTHYQRWRGGEKKVAKPSMLNKAKTRISSYRPIAAIPFFEDLGTLGLLEKGYFQTGNESLFKDNEAQEKVKEHLDDVIASSAVIQEVLRDIESICTTGTFDGIDDNGKPQRNMNRKMVIMTSQPLVGLFILWAIEKQIRVLGWKTPTESVAKGASLRVEGIFGQTPQTKRKQILDGFQEKFKRSNQTGALELDKYKKPILVNSNGAHILVGTIQIIGTGINLYRAHHLDIVEAQFSPSSEAQAIKRVHRIGQTQETLVAIFTCNDILFERLVNDKMEFASQFGDAARTAAVSLGENDFDDDEEEEEFAV